MLQFSLSLFFGARASDGGVSPQHWATGFVGLRGGEEACARPRGAFATGPPTPAMSDPVLVSEESIARAYPKQHRGGQRGLPVSPSTVT